MNKICIRIFAVLLMVVCVGPIAHTETVTPETASPKTAEVSIQRIYFPFDSDVIEMDAAGELNHNIEWMEKNSYAYIILEGHCDEVGKSSYNMELGDRRARAVKAYMIEHGVPEERIIMIVSYGSTRPLNPGHRAQDLRENRRVEFVIR